MSILRIYSESELNPELRKKLQLRESAEDTEALSAVQSIVDDVRKRGIDAVRHYSEKFDGFYPDPALCSDREIQEAEHRLDPEIKKAFNRAADNIRQFHQFQKERLQPASTKVAGAELGFYYTPVENVAVYVPGGKAQYPSSVLMGVIPAVAAGVKNILLLSPADDSGKLSDVVLYCAKMAGANSILKIGGAHGVAAAAAGLYAPPAELIVGPGNRFVTAAKTLLSASGKIRIDQPAGPSEVIVIADETANPAFVASDLLSQAEHGEDSPAILLTTSRQLAEQTSKEIEKGLEERPERRSMKETSIRQHSYAIVFDDLKEAFRFSNEYAPEHLEICTKHPQDDLNRITAAGSVFLGHYAPVALGDYYSGTNHVLPTGGTGRMYSGLGVETYMKRITYQHPTQESLRDAWKPIQIMSKVEGLEHEHGHSVDVRFES
ncbi:MAG: histidinol dehydrogenase [Spirochaetaceae bacterium]|nr:histidinol dehydrogenase [Spirochaetaceae bacterium]|tara:strand:- start:29683 stop:30987 length:1305 start_codon:yes stop_codon:yes gene_type:complete